MSDNVGDKIETVGGLSVRSERIEFDASELLPCPDCGRPNAPNRAECLYCGGQLAGTSPDIDLRSRTPEPWEKGFCVVLLETGGAAFPASLPVDREVLMRASELGTPLPVSRLGSEVAAAAAAERMRESGMRCVVLGDEELDGEGPPTRLRSISADKDSFVLRNFNTEETFSFPTDALDLIVSGRIFEERSEQTIRKDKKKGVTELDSGSTTKDSGVLDLYFAGEPKGFRIEETGFDFSFLGAEKSMLASENLKKLADRLRSISPTAKYSSDYGKKRSFIAEIWPAQPVNDSKGVKRWNLGRSIANASITSNREQFTRYSRLLRSTI